MYQVLARKYRPHNFYELVGQQHVSKALTSALERGRLHHAYLFTGTRGVGKTTIARILAKCLNCETGITATPCEQCNVCQAVNEGRFIDLIEIDAASRTKVEDTRELLDNVPYAPTQGRFKVYLIDEVHMLSTHSFNALLKTLEEPPEHVKFLFATTDPQKLPITVISRCLQFTLRPLTIEEIHHHIDKILTLEQIHHDDGALWQLAESAQGSLRDALSLTDQAIAYGQGVIQQQDVKEMLGLIDKHLVYDLLLAIHQNQRQMVAELLLLFRQQAIDVAMVLDQLISTLHELALMQHLPNLTANYSQDINQKIQMLAQRISATDLQLYYQIACKGRDELNLAVTQAQGFEMCILRLLAFRPLSNNEIISSENVLPKNVSSQSIVIENRSMENALIEEKTEHLEIENITTVGENVISSMSDTVVNSIDEPTIDAIEQVTQQAVFEPLSQQDISDTDTQIIENPTAMSINVDNLNTYPQLDDLAEHFIRFDTRQNDLIDVFEQEASLQQQTSLKTKIQGLMYLDGTQDLVDVDDETSTPIIHQSTIMEAIPSAPSIPVMQENTALVQPLMVTEGTIMPSQIDTHQLSKVPELVQPNELSPQQILQLPEQDLTGQWTAEKYEYWLRKHSELSPVIQGFIQDGMMTGDIIGVSVLNIPRQYEMMLHGFIPHIEQALKKIDRHNSLQINWVEQLEVNVMTPLRLQQQREMKAHQQALKWLHQHQGIASFVQTFSGQIRDIELEQGE
ncbi:DNA polymerase III subunit gamma/tau [Moraxella sp. ZY210820]|uniref:DNA polymerase III subunit gamma/tau n=1 Tax=unclassified Moraxella TaxID=2685852 RepID=UPI00272F6225|nr:DNA polymerase III subunit gamma/tau [Moraxella sp. ZY210820]WLF84617.1 DNA polymerase III subunit gamma/tau [Moraxella sp. ZY210820]